MDMNNIMEQINNIKEQLTVLEEELKQITVKGTDSNEMITAVVTGKGEVKDYELNPLQIGSIKKDSLIKAVVEATNNGLQEAKKLEAKRKKEIVGDVDIPNMPGLF